MIRHFNSPQNVSGVLLDLYADSPERLFFGSVGGGVEVGRDGDRQVEREGGQKQRHRERYFTE